MTHIPAYSQVFQVGHRLISDLFKSEVVVEEKIDGCVALNTPILKDDLTWIPAGNIKVGDYVIGLVYEGKRLRLARSVVTVASPIRKPCVRVVTDRQEIIVSKDHPFWTRKTSSNNPSRWCVAERLKEGHSIPFIPVWETDTSWEAGYLAGQFDGEGSLVKHGKHQRVLSYYQRTSPSQEFVRSLLVKKGFYIREDFRKRSEKWQEVWTCIIAGGWGEILRFLGAVRPQRLLEKAQNCWVNGAINGLDKATVLSVSDAGEQVVMGLSTSTQTYWAGGLASHNSQFSFALLDGELRCRSKGKEMLIDAPEKMFNKAVETIKGLDLHPEWVYNAEFLGKPKHNVLAYERVPKGNLIVYDVCTGPGTYLDTEMRQLEVERLGLECIPVYFKGLLTSKEMLVEFLERTSILGGRIEGVVVKNHALFTEDKKFAIGKYVSEEFREVAGGEWRKANPTRKDIVAALIAVYSTQARYAKALQHLCEDGKITGETKDIGLLVREVPDDILKECEADIRDALFNHFWDGIRRGIVAGIPNWYKELLAQESFAEVSKEEQ